MKYILLLYFALIFSASYAQDASQDINTRLDVVGDIANRGSGLWMKPVSKPEIKGTLYLFNNWVNLATIISGDGKKINLNNLNYDTKQNRFVTKTAPDSVFVFSPQSIKQVRVNNKTFKRYNINDAYTYYELIAFGKGKEVLKRSYKAIKKGDKDPFTNSYKQDKYVLNAEYFLNSKLGFQDMKLKKKSFLKLFNEDSKVIKKIISKHKLSLKKDADIIKIFDYYKNYNMN